jgi:hypothetical protein
MIPELHHNDTKDAKINLSFQCLCGENKIRVNKNLVSIIISSKPHPNSEAFFYENLILNEYNSEFNDIKLSDYVIPDGSASW